MPRRRRRTSPRVPRRSQSQERRCQDRARARLPRGAGRHVFMTTTRSITPHAPAGCKAAEQLAARYPDDDEAQILCACAFNTSTARRQDLCQPAQGRGHPGGDRQAPGPASHGVAHYLIHLYDYPPIADKGIEPPGATPDRADAPHACTPSHVLLESALSGGVDRFKSMASGRSAQAAGDFHEQLQRMDYLVYTYLQLRRDKKAGDVVEAAHPAPRP